MKCVENEKNGTFTNLTNIKKTPPKSANNKKQQKESLSEQHDLKAQIEDKKELHGNIYYSYKKTFR